MCIRDSRWVSRRYVAGATLEDAVTIMTRLSSEGACFTIDVLGEEISTMDEAQYFFDEYVRAIAAIQQHGLDANISIKPTAFGLLIDEEAGMNNIRKLVKMAAEHEMFVRLDMEDHRVTSATIKAVVDLHNEGLTNVGTVLQGRLFRSLADIDSLETEIGPHADYRICKGIYLEPEEISFTSYQDIVDATNACVDKMLEAGAYVGIASHDYPVIDYGRFVHGIMNALATCVPIVGFSLRRRILYSYHFSPYGIYTRVRCPCFNNFLRSGPRTPSLSLIHI